MFVNCPRCGNEFQRRMGPGRHQVYCSRSCRQRMYEVRAFHQAQLLPLLPAPPSDRPASRILRYHVGLVNSGQTEHAVALGAITAHEFRALCGVVVRPIQTAFGLTSARGCKRCVALAEKYPPPTALKTFVDALIDDERRRRVS